MAIFDSDGTTKYRIKKIFNDNGNTENKIRLIYDNNSVLNKRIYSSVVLKNILNEPLKANYSFTGGLAYYTNILDQKIGDGSNLILREKLPKSKNLFVKMFILVRTDKVSNATTWELNKYPGHYNIHTGSVSWTSSGYGYFPMQLSFVVENSDLSPLEMLRISVFSVDNNINAPYYLDTVVDMVVDIDPLILSTGKNYSADDFELLIGDIFYGEKEFDDV